MIGLSWKSDVWLIFDRAREEGEDQRPMKKAIKLIVNQSVVLLDSNYTYGLCKFNHRNCLRCSPRTRYE